MFEQFTEGARGAVMHAQTEAAARSDEHLGGEHLLLGVLRPGSGIAAEALAEAGVTADAVRAAIDELYGPPPAMEKAEALASIGIDLAAVDARLTESFGEQATAPRPIPFDDDAKAALVNAAGLADGRPIGTEHVLLGLLDGRPSRKVLDHLGVQVAALAERLRGWA